MQPQNKVNRDGVSMVDVIMDRHSVSQNEALTLANHFLEDKTKKLDICQLQVKTLSVNDQETVTSEIISNRKSKVNPLVIHNVDWLSNG